MARDMNASIPGAASFTYGEFIRSDTAKKKNIPNVPNEEQWLCIEKLAVKILQPVRDKFGPIRINSGFRSVALCEAVGSNKNSNHARGQAADIEPMKSGVSLFLIFEWICNNLDFRELIAEKFPNGWVHVAYREGGNDKTLKLFDDKHHYTRVSLEDVRKIYG